MTRLASWQGIALFPKDCRQPMSGASNKPFDYMACGLALLESDVSQWCDTFVASGYARSCIPDDAHSIATALRWFIDHPAETRAMGERGQQQVLTTWNYERMFLPILGQLKAYQ
jgi:glycosyltransferase involved in cell wall biosynthesis